MALTPGTCLGPYEIVSILGAGGMGEVYRARDTRLGRDVAVKVLPAAVAVDPDRLRRFEQEARATGLLNHPNILAIHDVGTHEGTPYLVSELLEGETLRERLAGGALPVRKALEYAQQFARGLAAAHEKGIVHRDLKPENLFVTSDGRIKILDFGLAKLKPTSMSDGETQLATGPRATGAGVVMGTVGYMAPEQVRALAVDHRADIFAFGAVLYEMLSGRRAFQGQSQVDTLSAILNADPPELTALGIAVPTGLDRIARYCLEKSPTERFQSIRDVEISLGTVADLSVIVPQSLPPTRRQRRLPIVAAAIAVVAASVLGGFYIGGQSQSAVEPQFKQLTFRRGLVGRARFTPDHSLILYDAQWDGQPSQIFSMRRDSPETQALQLPSAKILSISTSGELAVLLRPTTDHMLARVLLAGGGVREVADHVEDADWAPDGSALAMIRTEPWRIEFPMGKVVYQPPPAATLDQIRFSPDGRLLAFHEHELSSAGRVMVLDLAGQARAVTKTWVHLKGGLAWSEGGREIRFSASDLGLNPSVYSVTLSGKERVIQNGPGGLSFQDVSSDGQALVLAEQQRSGMIRVSDDGPPTDLAWLDWSRPQGLSADGKLLLFVESGAGAGPTSITALRGTDGSPVIRLADGAATALSPSGRWALSRRANAIVVLPTGAGNPREVNLTGIEISGRLVAVWPPDEDRFIFVGKSPGGKPRMYSSTLEGKSTPITPENSVAVLQSGTPQDPPVLSADGSTVTVRAPDRRLWLYPVAGGEPRLAAGIGPNDQPLRWTDDGRALFVRNRGVTPVVISRVDVTTGVREPLTTVDYPDRVGMNGPPNPILLGPEARSIVFGYVRELSELFLVSGLR